MHDDDLNITAYAIPTTCGRKLNVSFDRDVCLYGDRDGDGNPFQFNMHPDDARHLADLLIRGADNIEARKERRAAAA